MAEPMRIDARLLDGRSSRPRPVTLSIDGDRLEIHHRDGTTAVERLSPDALDWQEPLGARHRSVLLAGGRRCEFDNGPALERFVRACGHRDSPLNRWQRATLPALAAVALVLASLAAAYRWGLPAVAEGLATWIPGHSLQALDRQLLESLDASGTLGPSRLAPDAVDDATRLGRQLLAAHPESSLHIRSAPGLGANAFALPGGSIVLTDALLELATDAREVAAVVGHELGHVRARHGLRQMLQTSMVAVAIGLWSGDFDSLLTVAGTVLVGASYSRRFEFEADAFAAETLHGASLSPRLLADMLRRLSEAGGGDGPRYLSSHPPTPERIRRLEAGAQRSRGRLAPGTAVRAKASGGAAKSCDNHRWPVLRDRPPRTGSQRRVRSHGPRVA